ncbi:MAG: mechanosensitive ion channel family protein [Candidatus Sedimenticola sp. PURPLELP]
MTELLTHTYYGNTLQEWLIALSIIVLSALLGRVAYWAFSRIARAFTSRTKSRLDDIIVDMIEEPIVFALIATGIWFGLKTLVLPEGLSVAISHGYEVLVAVLAGWMLARLFDAVYEEYLQPWAAKTESDLDDQLMPILRKGVKMVIWVMAIVIGLNNAGYDVGAVIAGLGIGGLALAMAAKDTVSNVFGGFTIFTDKPFRMKDRVKVAGYDGTIEEIGVRSTRLRTLDGRLVTIPNATFADSAVENVSVEPNRKIVLNLGLTYDTSPEKMKQAMDILRKIGEENENTEEKLVISFNGFGDFAMNIMFIYYIRSGAPIADTQTQMNLAILEQFNANELEFAFPTQTLYNVAATTA